MRFGKYRAAILIELLLILILAAGFWTDKRQAEPVFADPGTGGEDTAQGQGDFIRWVDFTVPCEALDFAYEQDVTAYE